MRFSFVSTVFLAACAANHETNLPPIPLPTFDEACVAETCATAATVSNANELQAAIGTVASWTLHGEHTTGCLSASDDIPVSGTVRLRGSDLAPPSTCGNGCSDVTFRLRGQIAGVTCIGAEHYFDFTTCDEIEVTDATLRFRTVLQDVHPGPVNYLPIVEVLPACNQACGQDELRCDATSTCWGNARDYCAYCLGGDNEVCACWSPDGFAQDWTSCSFFVSGDVGMMGTCSRGVCETN